MTFTVIRIFVVLACVCIVSGLLGCTVENRSARESELDMSIAEIDGGKCNLGEENDIYALGDSVSVINFNCHKFKYSLSEMSAIYE